MSSPYPSSFWFVRCWWIRVDTIDLLLLAMMDPYATILNMDGKCRTENIIYNCT